MAGVATVAGGHEGGREPGVATVAGGGGPRAVGYLAGPGIKVILEVLCWPPVVTQFRVMDWPGL